MDPKSPVAAGAQPVEPAPAKAVVKQRYFNRELSWLAFNRRVLDEACNARYPLLERLRFLSISADNLDEFFMVRVAGLKAHQLLGVEELSIDGLTVGQQLDAIGEAVDRLVATQYDVWTALRAALVKAGIHVVGDEPLDQRAEAWLDLYFREEIFPVLTPQAIDPAHPFPFIHNKGLSLLFEVKKGRRTVRELVMAPTTLKRFIRIPGKAARYIALETLDSAQDRLSLPALRSGARRRLSRAARQ